MDIIPQSQLNIPNIVSSLKDGKVIVYPTETCYGLGCDATNQAAVDRIFEIKGRQRDKTVLMLVDSVSMAQSYMEWSPLIDRIARTYWPGPVTVVGFAKVGILFPQGLVADDGTIALRVTTHDIAAEMSRNLGKPLVSTSANLAAHESPYDIDDVLSMFREAWAQPDIVIDGGVLPHQAPSTIVRVVNGKVEVLRQGEVVVK